MTVIRRVFDPSTIPYQPSTDSSGRTQVQSVAIPQDLPKRIAPTPPSPVNQRSLAGTFSLVRAAFVASQYRAGFWTGITPYLGSNSQSDPSNTQLDTVYNDFMLFSYLPDSKKPPNEVIRAWSSPTKRTAVLTAALVNLKLSPPVTTITVSDSTSGTINIPAPPAFAENKQGLVETPRVGPALAFRAETYRNQITDPWNNLTPYGRR